jgi:regulator of sigma E protease
MHLIVSIIVFLLVLGFLVFIHELGHFAVAKWTGMRVDEFALGFPPRIWGKKRGETTYALNAIPFGGYVKIHGENHDNEDHDPRAFDHKPVLARLAVMLAGVSMNVLFAYVALTIAFMVGFSSVAQDVTQIPGAVLLNRSVQIVGINTKSPAAAAGLQAGDTVESFETPDGQVRHMDSTDELIDYTKGLQAAGITDVTVHYNREGDEHTAHATLNTEGLALGISIQSQDTVRVPWYRAPEVAFTECRVIVSVTWDALKAFGVKLFAHAQLDPNVSGPIGIYQATATATKVGFAEVLFIMIVLSLNLALLNLLPLPALDGGRVLFLIIEAAFRKRIIQRRIEATLTNLSFFVLIGLMVVLTARDIFRLF